MRRKKWLFVFAPIGIVLFMFVGGEVVMHLWNWLLPALFGWRLITFWQALGLMVLCRILFGRLGGHVGPRGNWRRRMSDRWDRMTPEEREKFRDVVNSHYGVGPTVGGAEKPA
jgi:hypothetical protein